MAITLDGTNGVTASSPATIKASAYLDAAGGNTATINGKLPIALADVPAPTSAQVGAATAGLAYNTVGSYAQLWWSGASQKGPGSTVAGSSLYPANTYMAGDASNFGYTTTFGSPSGTWRLMGETGYYSTGSINRSDMYASVFLRIS